MNISEWTNIADTFTQLHTVIGTSKHFGKGDFAVESHSKIYPSPISHSNPNPSPMGQSQREQYDDKNEFLTYEKKGRRKKEESCVKRESQVDRRKENSQYQCHLRGGQERS